MAELSWPSPNHNDRSVTDAEYGHLAPWASDGVFQSGTDVVATSSGLQVVIRANKRAVVQSHAWYSGSSDVALTLAANSSGSTRTDTVVLRLDRSTWDVRAAVRQGTPGAGAPTLQRDTGDTGLWEIPLADVTVANGAASIAPGNVANRPLLQSGAVRACDVVTDIQTTLASSDIVYEASTGRWIGWTAAGGVVLYEDTGFVDVAIGGFWVNGSNKPIIRRRNGWVWLRGSVARTTATLQDNDTNSPIATIPSAFRPLADHNWFSGTTSMSHVRLQVGFSSGALAIVDLSGDIPIGRNVYLDTSWIAG